MTQKELQRAIDFLKYFGVGIYPTHINLTEGGNSVIANPDTEWKEFLGCTVNQVAEDVARATKRETKWVL